MQNKASTSLLLLLVAAILLFALRGRHASTAEAAAETTNVRETQRWEYMVVRSFVEPPALAVPLVDITELNVAGKEGWELVLITNNNNAILKRPLK